MRSVVLVSANSWVCSGVSAGSLASKALVAEGEEMISGVAEADGFGDVVVNASSCRL